MSDHWDFYFTRLADQVASIFVDLGIRENAPDPERPWLLWLQLPFNEPRDDGLCNSQEATVLAEIEDLLVEATKELNAVPVGRITTNGRREFYYYGTRTDDLETVVGQVMHSYPNFRWQAGHSHDPDWELYVQFLYPNAHDWQRIKNRQVIEQLSQLGDPLTKSRPVFHWAYFAEEAQRAQFVTAVQNLGFDVTNQTTAENEDSEHPLGVNFERVDPVDWDSINDVTIELFELAESLAGDYDGWETSVEKEA